MFGTIYNSIYFIAQAMNNAMKENGRASAASLVQHSRNMQLYGFNQLIRTDSNGNGISEYVILDTNWKEWELHSTYTVGMETELLWFRETPIHFPGGRPPWADTKCWFAEGKICQGGREWKITSSQFGSAWVTGNLFRGRHILRLGHSWNQSFAFM